MRVQCMIDVRLRSENQVMGSMRMYNNGSSEQNETRKCTTMVQASRTKRENLRSVVTPLPSDPSATPHPWQSPSGSEALVGPSLPPHQVPGHLNFNPSSPARQASQHGARGDSSWLPPLTSQVEEIRQMTSRRLFHHLLALQDGWSLVQGYDIGHGHVPHVLVYQAVPSLISSMLQSAGSPRLSRRLD
jgi:hypothetical protein